MKKYVNGQLNSLPNGKILDWSNLKELADHKNWNLYWEG